MKHSVSFSVVLALSLAIASCSKQGNKKSNCWPDSATERQVADKQAVVRLIDSQFFLVEQGTIDTRLKPCNLPAEYQIDGLAVTISGEVKETEPAFGQPCCTNNFVITKITR